MEHRYFDPDEPRFMSEKSDFDSYFNGLGKTVFENIADVESNLERTLGLKPDDLKSIHSRRDELLPPEQMRTMPEDPGFGYFCKAPPPEAVSNLKSLKILFNRSAEIQKDVKKKLYFTGEIDLEDKIVEEKSKYESQVDLVPYGFYVFNVRVYQYVLHSKYTSSLRAKELQVNQEFLCLSSTSLDVLRDRIACCNDFQPIDGDISENLSRKTTRRAIDVHKSAMFYISNEFFIDCRHPKNLDYSTAIREWGEDEGYKFGKVYKMEDTTLSELKPFRLGYPYLYLHQGTCEHLIIFTDARLLHPRDPMSSREYPFLVAFASLNGKFCFSCYVKTARYLVVDSERLPEDAAYMCTACLESFNYVDGKKIGQFKVFGYVARASLL